MGVQVVCLGGGPRKHKWEGETGREAEPGGYLDGWVVTVGQEGSVLLGDRAERSSEPGDTGAFVLLGRGLVLELRVPPTPPPHYTTVHRHPGEPRGGMEAGSTVQPQRPQRPPRAPVRSSLRLVGATSVPSHQPPLEGSQLFWKSSLTWFVGCLLCAEHCPEIPPLSPTPPPEPTTPRTLASTPLGSSLIRTVGSRRSQVLLPRTCAWSCLLCDLGLDTAPL